MNKTRIMPFLLLIAIVFLFIHTSVTASADTAASDVRAASADTAAPDVSAVSAGMQESERNIYVGDIIELKITSQELSEEVIREKFSAFEIVDLVRESGYYIIKLRTFETGEKRVVLGDKEIVVVVRSALQELQSDGAMEGDLSPESPASGIPWLFIFCVLLAVFAVTGFVYLKDRLVKKSKVSLTPYQRFLSQSESVALDDDEYFVKQTRFFKEYIEAVYQCKIKGLTSSEILVIVNKLPRMQSIKQELGLWLRECDFFKFAGTTAPKERKKEMQSKLAALVGSIEAAGSIKAAGTSGAARTAEVSGISGAVRAAEVSGITGAARTAEVSGISGAVRTAEVSKTLEVPRTSGAGKGAASK